jgi:hypothetical protein
MHGEILLPSMQAKLFEKDYMPSRDYTSGKKAHGTNIGAQIKRRASKHRTNTIKHTAESILAFQLVKLHSRMHLTKLWHDKSALSHSSESEF